MRKRWKQMLTLLLIIGLISPLLSLNVSAATKKQRVFDEANLLSETEIIELEALAEKYSVKRETDFIILTTEAPGISAQKYMGDFYDDKGLGYDKKHGNTAIITLNMANREVYLAGFYKGEKYLSDQRLNHIRNDLTPHLSNGDYAKAFTYFIERSDYYFDFKPHVDPDSVFYKTSFQFLLAFIISLMIVGAMFYQSSSKITTTARTYQDGSRSKIISQKDRFIRRVVTKTHSPQSKSSGGGGGGRTGGGHSHSGSGGRF